MLLNSYPRFKLYPKTACVNGLRRRSVPQLPRKTTLYQNLQPKTTFLLPTEYIQPTKPFQPRIQRTKIPTKTTQNPLKKKKKTPNILPSNPKSPRPWRHPMWPARAASPPMATRDASWLGAIVVGCQQSTRELLRLLSASAVTGWNARVRSLSPPGRWEGAAEGRRRS